MIVGLVANDWEPPKNGSETSGEEVSILLSQDMENTPNTELEVKTT
jgi:hypothetical protein